MIKKIGVLKTKDAIQCQDEYVIPFELIEEIRGLRLKSNDLYLSKKEMREALMIVINLIKE